MPDAEAEKKASAWLEACLTDADSSGGCIMCRVNGLMSGIGEPVFDKLDAELGKALFSIGAVKAVEIGDGIAVSERRGSENNDQYSYDLPHTHPVKTSNHAGGVYGGLSDGSALTMKVHFKPTPSISRPQQALTADGQVRELVITGRHDPVIVPRAVVVVESMVAITLLDLILRNMTATLEGIRRPEFSLPLHRVNASHIHILDPYKAIHLEFTDHLFDLPVCPLNLHGDRSVILIADPSGRPCCAGGPNGFIAEPDPLNNSKETD